MRRLQYALWGLVAICGLALGIYYATWSEQFGQNQAGDAFGASFLLYNHREEPVTEKLFRQRPSAIYFGYTSCPDFCPTALHDMSQWAKELGNKAEEINFVFVTVDPERDTVRFLENYITAFSDRIIGITGPPRDVRTVLKDYKVFWKKGPVNEDGDYPVDHVTSIYLLDADGRFAGTIAHNEDVKTALAKLKRLLDR